MKQRGVKSILIIYESGQTREYLCLSTFFALCGMLTTGKKWDEKEVESYLDSKCELLLFLGVPPCIESERCVFLRKDYEQSLLDTVLTEMVKRDKLSPEDADTLRKIKTIYIRNNLRVTEYNGQFYFYIRSEVEKAFQSYYKACTEIRMLQKEDKENPYFWFVRGQFVRRMQGLSAISKTEKIFNIEPLIGRLNEIALQNEGFVSFYALMGYLAETDEELKPKAYDYYKKCIDTYEAADKVGPCFSMIYYRSAHWLECQKKDRQGANGEYEKSYACDKDNYRAYYKLARYQEQIARAYDEAYAIYSQIQSQLEKIKENRYLQPIENEYLFKVYFCKWKMMEKKQMEYDGGIITEKLQGITRQSIEDAFFFRDFYGKDAEQYFNYMMERTKEFQRKL